MGEEMPTGPGYEAEAIRMAFSKRDEQIATLRALLREAAPKCEINVTTMGPSAACGSIAVWCLSDPPLLLCDEHYHFCMSNGADKLAPDFKPCNLGIRIKAALEEET